MLDDNHTHSPISISANGVALSGSTDAVPPQIAEQMEEASLSRRTFLKASGLAATGAIFASCTGKPKKVVPTVREEQGIKPGQHYWYASTCAACSAACGIHAKVRDARPIKLEGNPEHPLSQGGLCAKGQASLLGLYDADRLRAPEAKGTSISWGQLYERTITSLKAEKAGNICLVTGSEHGPSMQRAIAAFLQRWPNAEHIVWDAIGHDASLDAHLQSHGERALPSYDFAAAELIVSFGADFLGTWISPVEFAADWAKGRRLEGSAKKINRLVMLEAGMSLTGSNADTRYRVVPSQRGAAIAQIYQRLLAKAGRPAEAKAAAECTALSGAELDSLASELWAARGTSLVVADTTRQEEALVVNAINDLLGNYGKTLSLARPSLAASGSNAGMVRLLDAMEAGEISVLITLGVNPVYGHHEGARFATAMAKVPTSLVLSDRVDETASLASMVGPLHHFLESWNDHQPQRGLFSISQPMVRPLFTTEAAGKVLLTLAESPWALRQWRAFIRDTWRSDVMTLTSPSWEACIEAGLLDRRDGSASEPAWRAQALAGGVVEKASKPSLLGDGYELALFESVAMGDGRHANNPWLQELPDPLTKATWDNFAIVSPATLKALGADEGDLVELNCAGLEGVAALSLPLISQPGQAEGTVSLALGYGRTAAGRLADSVPEGTKAIGVNAAALRRTQVLRVDLKKAGGKRDIARSQTHDSQEGRPLAAETTLAAYMSDRASGRPHAHDNTDKSMWKELEHKGHYWGMSVDLNACNGCSGCIVGCQAENNIPVVGKDEVFKRRDMAWLRLDRYYSDGGERADDLSIVDENPHVMHQPMMCQHCDNAPCETVCPVAATTHSEEGLNQQTYNRCVGTRYCANNCPYKVRRFNWFDYKHDDPTLNLVLNPDVAIRSRGVMEKCSLCIQRIYDAKLAASRDGRAFKDGDFKTACQQSCPTHAIVVGDLNDPESAVAKMRKSERSYEVLGELNVKSGIRYMTRVRNTQES